MPNYVTNKISITTANTDRAKKIISEICGEENNLDFNKIVDQPVNIYHGAMFSCDDIDFPNNNWIKWNIENWGSELNAINSEVKIDNGIINITFDTLDNVPYPIIMSIANRYFMRIKHEYFSKDKNIWGIDYWQNRERSISHKNRSEDKERLRIELTGTFDEKFEYDNRCG